ncbi:hypothetical protein O181_085477 [Austropuccinia psidii MF-1]|uniref:Glycerophosphocholine acyltransferase 1 n=1 Tax=Austropuccinia psidii MF-1 TaxID=1389203 RepID=A0A9Q3FY38_9BASI|nr:hypothetical protein [Austropuccinia psidii MF-1]
MSINDFDSSNQDKSSTSPSNLSNDNNNTPDYLINWKEDLFGDGLPFYDLLVFIDSYIDLFKRRTLKTLKDELGSRSKPLRDECLSLAKEAQNVLESKFIINNNQSNHHSKIKSNPSNSLKLNQKQSRSQSQSQIKNNFNLHSLGLEFYNGIHFKKNSNFENLNKNEIELRQLAERELKDFIEKLKIRIKKIQSRWNDSKTVSLREKTSFFFGVQNVLITALLLAFWPEYIPLSYTLQAAYYLPLRIYTYRRLAYHYFLFDLCYVINGLCLVFLWFFPSNVLLFEACYGLSHGPSAIAIATWRNSLVFHSVEKVTSLFIHIYPAIVFTVIRHFYPNASRRYPALIGLESISLSRTLIICSTIYITWQTLYYRFVIVARAQKIAQEGRPTSFTYLLNSKTGLISKLLRSVKPEWRANGFMIAQFIYTLVTMLPSLLWFYQSKTLSGLFLWFMFSVSVWNGASFYMEVFGRRFEKELKKLKQEIDILNPNENGDLNDVGSASTDEEPKSTPNNHQSQFDKVLSEGQVTKVTEEEGFEDLKNQISTLNQENHLKQE